VIALCVSVGKHWTIADASELINFTMTLLRKRYSVDDITKIWGGNWLYLMEKVQSMRK
jgi:microsomal dipeptidase-like Zn-dependent dipeptidase